MSEGADWPVARSVTPGSPLSTAAEPSAFAASPPEGAASGGHGGETQDGVVASGAPASSGVGSGPPAPVAETTPLPPHAPNTPNASNSKHPLKRPPMPR